MIGRLLLRLLRRYQSAGGGDRWLVACNFNPSCSVYAMQALEKYGAMRGSLLALRRVSRCRNRQQLGVVDDRVP